MSFTSNRFDMFITTIHVFISHSWTYDEHYSTLREWIFERSWTLGKTSQLKFEDHSVPKDNPIHNAGTDEQLRWAIYERIKVSDVIVFPTGMYASYSKWMQKEVEGAERYRKPTLSVKPRGAQKESLVKEKADKSVNWNSESVVQGIYELYKTS